MTARQIGLCVLAALGSPFGAPIGSLVAGAQAPSGGEMEKLRFSLIAAERDCSAVTSLHASSLGSRALAPCAYCGGRAETRRRCDGCGAPR